MYQFLFYEHCFIREMPPKELDESVVLSDLKSVEELFAQGYLSCKLDTGEYLYVKGEELIQVFEGLGCNFYNGEK